MAYLTQDLEDVKTKARAANRSYGESTECVAAVKYFTGAPQTALWKKGALVKGNLNLAAGTAIATFENEGKYRGHAAIYAGQSSEGLHVYDQWNGQNFHARLIRFRNGSGRASNDGDRFYVIE